MIQDIYIENSANEDNPRKPFDDLDAEVIEKLKSNLINVDETVKGLEKWYKGKIGRANIEMLYH